MAPVYWTLCSQVSDIMINIQRSCRFLAELWPFLDILCPFFGKIMAVFWLDSNCGLFPRQATYWRTWRPKPRPFPSTPIGCAEPGPACRGCTGEQPIAWRNAAQATPLCTGQCVGLRTINFFISCKKKRFFAKNLLKKLYSKKCPKNFLSFPRKKFLLLESSEMYAQFFFLGISQFMTEFYE